MIGFVCVMHKSKLRVNGFDLIDNFIKTLFKYCKRNFTLYLFDNESDEKYNIPNYPNIKYTYIEDQSIRGLLVYNNGTNMAIEDGCDVVITVNDDVVFNKTINNFIDIIRNHEHKDVGVYSCLSNGILQDNSLQKASGVGKGMLEITKLKKSHGILNGFILGFTREFYHKFKLLNGNLWDKNFPWGGGEKALINRIKPRGGRVFIIKDCWLFHHKIRGWKLIVKKTRRRKRKESYL